MEMGTESIGSERRLISYLEAFCVWIISALQSLKLPLGSMSSSRCIDV